MRFLEFDRHQQVHWVRGLFTAVKLVSSDEFEIKPGDNGFGPNSSFTELGLSRAHWRRGYS